MQKWRILWLACFWFSPMEVSANPMAPHILEAIDADGRMVALNPPNQVTVIISSSQTTQTQTRAAGKSLDEFQGLPDFRIIIVTDLRGSLAGLVPSYVKRKMQSDLTKEAKRIQPFYLKNGSSRNPRLDVSAIPDHTGAVCTPLGIAAPLGTLWVIVYGRKGEVFRRWDDLKNYAELQQAVMAALQEK
jgi:hypothetical protein